MRRILPAAIFLLAVAAAWWFWPRSPAPVAHSGALPGGATKSSPTPLPTIPAPTDSRASSADTATATTPLPPPAPTWREEDFPIIAPLNKPGSTIARDLDVVNAVLDAWRTNFPREGNPIGENADITAALAGANRLELALIPKKHSAINASGELCDRWGTPFRFHQLSGEQMEIRSAGPDRKFATEDDAVFNP